CSDYYLLRHHVIAPGQRSHEAHTLHGRIILARAITRVAVRFRYHITGIVDTLEVTSRLRIAALADQATGIDKIDRVLFHIGIEIHFAGKESQGIFAEETTYRWIVISGAVVIQAG